MMNKLSSKYEYIHGVFVLVGSIGILLVGAPGAGKSRLAYELILQGNTLVADDIIKCQVRGQSLFGLLHNSKFKGNIHIRDIGLINVEHVHAGSVQTEAIISVCVSIGDNCKNKSSINICGVNIPFYNIKAGKATHIYSIIQRLSIS